MTEGVAVKGDSDAHRFTGWNDNLGEPLKFARRTEDAARGTYIELNDLGTVTHRGVGDRQGRPILIDSKIGVLEA